MIDTTDMAPAAAAEAGADDSVASPTGSASPAGGTSPTGGASAAPAPPDGRRRTAAASSPPRPPQIHRPPSLARPPRPVEPPLPDHPHLPGWVRRAAAQARPILADLLGTMDGEVQARFRNEVEHLTGTISSGRFSAAWQYPGLISHGVSLLEAGRRESAERARAQRALDLRRRRAADTLRDAADRLAPDVVARLSRALREAATEAQVDAAAAEVQAAAAAARSTEDRRREKQIDRTRSRIRRVSAAAGTSGPAETWQDVLRRFAESQVAE